MGWRATLPGLLFIAAGALHFVRPWASRLPDQRG